MKWIVSFPIPSVYLQLSLGINILSYSQTDGLPPGFNKEQTAQHIKWNRRNLSVQRGKPIKLYKIPMTQQGSSQAARSTKVRRAQIIVHSTIPVDSLS